MRKDTLLKASVTNCESALECRQIEDTSRHSSKAPNSIQDISQAVGKSLSDEEKYNILVDKTQPSQDYRFPEVIRYGRKRSFLRKWLSEHSWLSYSGVRWRICRLQPSVEGCCLHGACSIQKQQEPCGRAANVSTWKIFKARWVARKGTRVKACTPWEAGRDQRWAERRPWERLPWPCSFARAARPKVWTNQIAFNVTKESTKPCRFLQQNWKVQISSSRKRGGCWATQVGAQAGDWGKPPQGRSNPISEDTASRGRTVKEETCCCSRG